jgi:hypothetical protein
MRIVTITLLAVLPLLGCPAQYRLACECGDLSDMESPVGDYDITEAWKAGLEEGEAAVTDEAVVFRYTDDEGNQWEVEYAIIDEIPL